MLFVELIIHGCEIDTPRMENGVKVDKDQDGDDIRKLAGVKI